jgi:predicted nuclease of restriction endonuclease-like (RecB) superfamily
MKLKRCGEDGLSGNSTGQIATQFYERTALSRNKAAVIKEPRNPFQKTN